MCYESVLQVGEVLPDCQLSCIYKAAACDDIKQNEVREYDNEKNKFLSIASTYVFRFNVSLSLPLFFFFFFFFFFF